ncbi:MAG: gliding motility-associated C-terminal domain-containing protein, partial [Cyclobacteriaceae bacterium]|nr:gliding motility-associated C-terminal domain-containing protein [Cyclobacteriaceae bacterium]
IADAPVITNVTVDKTDGSAGQVTVSWMAPFDLDKTLFGTVYKYEVQRSEGLAGGNYVKVGETSDSTFTDTGLNTLDKSYSYRVILYTLDGAIVSPTDPVDTSAVASTVWLTPRALAGQIELFWLADVPWSNNSQDFPWHYIYRAPEGATEDQLVLIDSVNVNLWYYNYIDSGQYNNTPLKDTDVYCYYVITKGTYGNPKVFEPLLNKSQMICAQPKDDIVPCPPVITAIPIDCETFLEEAPCSFNQFENILTWKPGAGAECQDDIQLYEIYVANSSTGEFQYHTFSRDTVFVDTNLGSFARCYKVRAIDRSGNVSDYSEPFCFDNCPYYELPNVFTPGNNDGCNDYFSAYSSRVRVGEGGVIDDCGEIDESKCARFVESVRFTVFNRWGGLVYTYQSGGENTIYIDWDGRGNNGREVSNGVYYYHAEVIFDLVDPSERVKEYKGWIEILR